MERSDTKVMGEQRMKHGKVCRKGLLGSLVGYLSVSHDTTNTNTKLCGLEVSARLESN